MPVVSLAPGSLGLGGFRFRDAENSAQLGLVSGPRILGPRPLDHSPQLFGPQLYTLLFPLLNRFAVKFLRRTYGAEYLSYAAHIVICNLHPEFEFLRSYPRHLILDSENILHLRFFQTGGQLPEYSGNYSYVVSSREFHLHLVSHPDTAVILRQAIEWYPIQTERQYHLYEGRSAHIFTKIQNRTIFSA